MSIPDAETAASECGSAGRAVDVTAQLRSWTRRSGRARYRWVAGLVATLGGTFGLVAIGQPALAVNPMADLSIVAPPSFHKGDTHDVVVHLDSMSTTLNDSIQVSLTISNASQVATLDFTVTKVLVGSAFCPNLTNDGFTCTFPYKGSSSVTVTYTIQNETDNVATGATTTFDKSLIAVNDITNPSVTNSLSQYFILTLLGPAPATTISGETDDATTGNPVPDALVSLHDSAAHSYTTRSDSLGKFSFPADASHPVAAGQVTASASKSGYKTRAGQPVTFTPGTPISNWKLLVTPVVAARPSRTAAGSPVATPSPDGSASPNALPTGAPASAIAGGSGPAFGDDPQLASANGGGSDLTYVLIGGLILILAGIAIMVSMFVRRRRAGEDGEDGGGYPPDYQSPYDPAPVPARGGMGPAYPHQQSEPVDGSPRSPYPPAGPPQPPTSW